MPFLFFTLACGPTPGDSGGLAAAWPEPTIAVSPEAVDFGELDALMGESAKVTISIHNLSSSRDLHLREIGLSDVDAPVDIGLLDTVLVPPSSATELELTYVPGGYGSMDTALVIESDDPGLRRLEVPLVGKASAPRLKVNPSSFDFGTLFIGCSASQAMSLKNTGDVTLVIEGGLYANNESGELTLDLDQESNGDIGESWEIAPRGTVEFWVHYAPLDEEQDVTYVEFSSNDPSALTARQVHTGNGALAGETTDTFEQESAESRQFSLSETPVPGTLDVAVDGMAVVDGWVHDVASNYVEFEVGSLPGVGATITVHYARPGDCDD